MSLVLEPPDFSNLYRGIFQLYSLFTPYRLYNYQHALYRQIAEFHDFILRQRLMCVKELLLKIMFVDFTSIGGCKTKGILLKLI